MEEEHTKKKPKKVKLKKYEFGRLLGSGAFGRVKIAKNKETGKYTAIKILTKKELIKQQQVDHIYNEVKILSMMDHPFIVKFEGFTQDTKFLYIVIELINGGELFPYLRQVGKFPYNQAM